MSIQKAVIEKGLKQVVAQHAINVCFMLDEQGREVQVTPSMVQGLCAQLLKRCKKKAQAA